MQQILLKIKVFPIARRKIHFKQTVESRKKLVNFQSAACATRTGGGDPVKFKCINFTMNICLNMPQSPIKKKILDRRMSCNKGNLGQVHVY